jgi:saccharopine dehydrogenase (NAD+, L-lysine-forming)
MRILVLGGAGAMAQVTIRDLSRSKTVGAVGIAYVDFQKARRFAKILKDERAIPLRTDVRQVSRLSTQMQGWDVVINSTWYEFNLKVMSAAIRAGIHYLDLGGLYHMTLKQLKLDRRAKDADVTCVLGIESTPGTMNVMAAQAASLLDRVRTIRLRSGFAVVSPRETFQPPFSIRTILDEFTMPAIIFRSGKIVVVPAHGVLRSFFLPEPVGQVEGYVSIHSELATLPFSLGKGLRNMDFTIAYPSNFSKLMLNLIQLGLVSKNIFDVRGARIRNHD